MRSSLRISLIMGMVLTFTVQLFAATGQQMTVAPVAQKTWDELVQIDTSWSKSSMPEVEFGPFELLPPSREIGPLGKNVMPPEVPSQPANTLSTLGFPVVRSFQALPDNGSIIPPDVDGAVGPDRVMTFFNSQLRIQSLIGTIISTISYSAFWTPTGVSTISDPRVLYDPAAGRFYATTIADFQTSSASVLLAVSANSNPGGSWTYFKIDADPTNATWADYPDIGFNQTWIALTGRMFVNPNGGFVGTSMWAVDKSSALSGGPLNVTFFPVGSDNFGGFGAGSCLRVCETFGAQPKLYVVDNVNLTSGGVHLLRISEITGTGPAATWSATAGSSFAGSGLFLVVHNFSGNQIGASQPTTATRINTNDSRALNAVYRNGHIWFTHSAGLPTGSVNRTAVFWYEVNPAAFPNPIVQSGLLDGGADVHYYFPAITANSRGDAFLGFTHSDGTHFAEAVYTSRLAADPAGTMAPISVLKAGEAAYIKDFGSGRVRWGDYSATVVDPTDSVSFWTIQEYAAMDVGPGESNDRWGTWWGTTLADLDHDSIPDSLDNCPFVVNTGQADADTDGVGDICDNCINVKNLNQTDTDGDGLGDACDPDIDNDGVLNAGDNCRYTPNLSQLNSDADSLGDACDNCPLVANNDQYDVNHDGIGDACDGLLHIHTQDLADTVLLGHNFDYYFHGVGGTSPYTWSLVGGDLPLGLTFDGGGVGRLYGVPNYAFTFFFNIAANDVSDPVKGDTVYLSMTVIEPPYVCGDADHNLLVNISDAVYLIAYIFGGGPAPNPLQAGDVDCNGLVNISDAVYLINFIFGGGPPPCPSC